MIKEEIKKIFEDKQLMILLAFITGVLIVALFGLAYPTVPEVLDSNADYTWFCVAWADEYCNNPVEVNLTNGQKGYYPQGLFDNECEKYCMDWTLHKKGLKSE